MHPEARAGLAEMIRLSGIDTDHPWKVLDLGGQDINGSIRDLLPKAEWTGVDIQPGVGVNLAHDCTKPWPKEYPTFDIVVTTETLEHVAGWRSLLKTCGQALTFGGAGLLFITAASTGRRPHGATGAMNPAPGEWYRNVPWQELSDELETLYTYSTVTYNPNPGDVYGWAAHPKPAAIR